MGQTSDEYQSFMANLPADPRERAKIFSAVVRGGMKQVTADFTSRIEPLGFKRRRDTLLWTRKRKLTVDNVGLHRSGSTYGAPRNASVSLQMSFSIGVPNGSSTTIAVGWGDSDKLQTSTGKPYHMRFNAVTGDSYDKTLDALVACLVDHGEPWFATHGDDALLRHPDVKPEIARLLGSADSR